MKIPLIAFAVALLASSPTTFAALGEGEVAEISYSVFTDNAGYVLESKQAGIGKILARTDALRATVFVDDFNGDGCDDAIFYEGVESGFNISVYECQNGEPVRQAYVEDVEQEFDIFDFDSDGEVEFVFFSSVQELENRYPYYLFPVVYRRSFAGLQKVDIACFPAARKYYEFKLRAWASFFNRNEVFEMKRNAPLIGDCS